MNDDKQTQKISIRFFNDKEIRAVWNDASEKWMFSVQDVISAVRNENSYEKTRNYWKYLKNKLKKVGSEVVSATTQLKLMAPDGKMRLSDVIDSDGIVKLLGEFPIAAGSEFLKWFVQSEESIDGKSKQKAYALFESALLDVVEIGTVKGLQQIHGYIFGGLYDFAGKIRTHNISKGGFSFANAQFLHETLKKIEKMPEDSFDHIVEKYVEMNVAHPFMEGNGRSTRIWLDLIFKKNLGQCIDWSKIKKNEYLNAMKKSVTDDQMIKELLSGALTSAINDRSVFMKGIDYSYYYESVDDV